MHCPSCGGSGKSGYSREVPAGPHSYTTQFVHTGGCAACKQTGFVKASRTDRSVAVRCFMCQKQIFRAPSSWGGAYRCSRDGSYIGSSEITFFGTNCKIHDVPAKRLPSMTVYYCAAKGTAWLCEGCVPRSGKCPGRCGRSSCGAALERDTGSWYDCD